MAMSVDISIFKIKTLAIWSYLKTQKITLSDQIYHEIPTTDAGFFVNLHLNLAYQDTLVVVIQTILHETFDISLPPFEIYNNLQSGWSIQSTHLHIGAQIRQK